MEALIFLLPPLVLCIALVGIHCYLGLHVLARGVIFVDLALAQVAVLGSSIAFLMGFEHEAPTTYFISLGVTTLVAGFLAYSNRFRFQFSQEALIGILYAFSSAVMILIIDKMSHGAEHLKQSLVGNLLWVTWADAFKVSVIYSVVGFFHYYFREQLIRSSFAEGSHWKYDFLFYALFSVVITSSVHYAGVLIVFSFLIVPAMVSSLFLSSIKARLLFGWGLGVVLSTLGMFLSYVLDLPSGAVIVSLFTILPILMVFFWKQIRKCFKT